MKIDGLPETTVGGALQYKVQYSVSYTDDTDVVIWAPLPSIADGTVSNFTPSYGQNPEPLFNSCGGANVDDCQYVTTDTLVGDVLVPAGSVYWHFNTLSAGDTGTVKFKINTKNGWENGIQYDFYASIDGAL
ncbi:MAG: hypothetical protein H6546_06980 [Chitinophagales bacterium]|nr:hypothetical protein [Chitinophagales bacterium]